MALNMKEFVLEHCDSGLSCCSTEQGGLMEFIVIPENEQMPQRCVDRANGFEKRLHTMDVKIDDVARADDEIRPLCFDESDRFERAFQRDDRAEVEVAEVSDPETAECRGPARRLNEYLPQMDRYRQMPSSKKSAREAIGSVSEEQVTEHRSPESRVPGAAITSL